MRSKPHYLRKISGAVLGVAASAALMLGPAASAHAATALTSQAKVTFTFDDGLGSALSKAAPTLASYGFVGTDYAISDCVGSSGTCDANPDASYMTWAQLQQLQNTYHWEIGSHSVTHPLMTTLSASKLEYEVYHSRWAFQQHDIFPTAFATPYGDYNPTVQAAVAKYYTSHRGFADQQYMNDWPYNDYLLYDKQVQAGVTVAQVKAWVDQAIQNKSWLVLTFHNISDNPSSDPQDYEYSTSDLAQIAAYVKSKSVPAVTTSGGLVSGDTNLLDANNSFNNGVASGWTTDSSANVTKDTNSHGSAPSPQNSIKLTSNTSKAVHLFSPKVSVNSTRSYVFKTYLNLPAVTSNAVDFFIDEYDASGNWISGQNKVSEPDVNTENVNFTYKPTSSNVKSIRYQIGLGAGPTGTTAYVDNVRMFTAQ